MPQIRTCQQILQQIERRPIEPLQVVEEQHQWMVRPGEHADEPPKDQLETPARVLGREIRSRRQASDDELQFRNELDDEPCIRAEGVAERVAPGCQIGFALSQKSLDQALKRLSERRIWDVTLVLIEFTRCEQTARRNKRFIELIHNGGLADTGMPGNKNELRLATGYDAVERSEQGV